MILRVLCRDLAREFDVTPRAIRFYEDQGLLSPEREGPTGASIYDHNRPDDVLRSEADEGERVPVGL